MGGNSDGMTVDRDGDIYITDITWNGIVKYDQRAATMTLLASDASMHWPDTIGVMPGGDLLFTASALNEHFMGLIKSGDERYQLWRLPLEQK